MNGVVPQVGKPCLDFRIGKTSIDLLIEPINDLNGRILGDANSIPAAGLSRTSAGLPAVTAISAEFG